MHANVHDNWMLFIIRFIDLSFMHYFKLQKFKFEQLINEKAIDLSSS